MASSGVKVSNVRVSNVPHCRHQRAMGGRGQSQPHPSRGKRGQRAPNPTRLRRAQLLHRDLPRARKEQQRVIIPQSSCESLSLDSSHRGGCWDIAAGASCAAPSLWGLRSEFNTAARAGRSGWRACGPLHAVFSQPGKMPSHLVNCIWPF